MQALQTEPDGVQITVAGVALACSFSSNVLSLARESLLHIAFSWRVGLLNSSYGPHGLLLKLMTLQVSLNEITRIKNEAIAIVIIM